MSPTALRLFDSFVWKAGEDAQMRVYGLSDHVNSCLMARLGVETSQTGVEMFASDMEDELVRFVAGLDVGELVKVIALCDEWGEQFIPDGLFGHLVLSHGILSSNVGAPVAWEQAHREAHLRRWQQTEMTAQRSQPLPERVYESRFAAEIAARYGAAKPCRQVLKRFHDDHIADGNYFEVDWLSCGGEDVDRLGDQRCFATVRYHFVSGTL